MAQDDDEELKGDLERAAQGLLAALREDDAQSIMDNLDLYIVKRIEQSELRADRKYQRQPFRFRRWAS